MTRADPDDPFTTAEEEVGEGGGGGDEEEEDCELVEGRENGQEGQEGRRSRGGCKKGAKVLRARIMAEWLVDHLLAGVPVGGGQQQGGGGGGGGGGGDTLTILDIAGGKGRLSSEILRKMGFTPPRLQSTLTGGAAEEEEAQQLLPCVRCIVVDPAPLRLSKGDQWLGDAGYIQHLQCEFTGFR